MDMNVIAAGSMVPHQTVIRPKGLLMIIPSMEAADASSYPRRFSDDGRWLYSRHIVSTLLAFMNCTNIYKDTDIHNIHHTHIHNIHIHNCSCRYFPYWNQTYQWRPLELSFRNAGRWWQRHGLPRWTPHAGLGVCAVPSHRRIRRLTNILLPSCKLSSQVVPICSNYIQWSFFHGEVSTCLMDKSCKNGWFTMIYPLVI